MGQIIIGSEGNEEEIIQKMYNDTGYILKKFDTLEKMLKLKGVRKAREELSLYHLDVKDVMEESEKNGGFAECKSDGTKVVCEVSDDLLDKFPFDLQGKAKMAQLFLDYSALVDAIKEMDIEKIAKTIKEIRSLIQS